MDFNDSNDMLMDDFLASPLPFLSDHGNIE